MSAEKPTPERIVVDFPKTEIADEKTPMTEAMRLANLAPGEAAATCAPRAGSAHLFTRRR